MVYIFLAPGFEEAEALVPADLLRRAGVETALVGVSEGPVPGGHGITVLPDMPLSAVTLDNAEILVLPGGGVGVQNLGESPTVRSLFVQADERGIPIAAICAAPSLLGRWNLLHGRNAVCYPDQRWECHMSDGQLHPDCGTVTDGTLTTGRAAGSAFAFGLRLVARLKGEETADRIAAGIHYPG